MKTILFFLFAMAMSNAAWAGRLPDGGGKHPSVKASESLTFKIVAAIRAANRVRVGMSEGEGPKDPSEKIKRQFRELQVVWKALDDADMKVVGDRMAKALLRKAFRDGDAQSLLLSKIEQAVLFGNGPLDIGAYVEQLSSPRQAIFWIETEEAVAAAIAEGKVLTEELVGQCALKVLASLGVKFLPG